MSEFKERFLVGLGILVVLSCFVGGFYYLENHEGICYTQIDNSRVELISNSDEMKYEYKLDSYDESGRKNEIKFKTSRELREDAYLRLYIRAIGVHKWEEVQFEELPVKVQNKFNP